MTTFQVLIQTLLKALSAILPLSPTLVDALTRHVLDWSLPFAEIELLVVSIASIVLFIYFRFDWLGMLSAALTSVLRPMSLRAETRSLDQHTLLFLMVVFLPIQLCHIFLQSSLSDALSGVSSSALAGVFLILLGIGFFASARWNKRIHGLNHLRLNHAFMIAGIGLFALIPGVPLIGLLLVAFAFCNYTNEALAKISSLILGLFLFSKASALFQDLSLKGSIAEIGYLNSAAVLVIAFTVIWISLENLQKSISENTFKNFQWLSILSGFVLVALFFMGKIPE